MRTPFITIAILLLPASVGFSAKDSCFDCHSGMDGMSTVFEDDVHYKFGIGCAGCHGGDPKESVPS